MSSVLYVGLQDADKIVVFSIDEAGRLTKQSEAVATGGPSVMAASAHPAGFDRAVEGKGSA